MDNHICTWDHDGRVCASGLREFFKKEKDGTMECKMESRGPSLIHSSEYFSFIPYTF